jgi:tetraacyldisaccharide 4'-kinase
MRAVADDDTTWLAGKTVVAFAGIANPQRFFTLLEELGAHLAGSIVFPDHHPLTRSEAKRLLSLARKEGARLVTTEKDWERLRGDVRLPKALIELTHPLAIKLELDERDLGRLMSLIEAATKLVYPRRSKRPPQL